jgi:hypothetical protein
VRRLQALAARFALVVIAAALAPAASLAAGPGQYGPPEWLPLRVSSDGQPYDVGCVKMNCTIDGAPYHNYWAIDFIDHADQPGAPVFAAGRGQVMDVVGSFTACGPSNTPANFVYIDHGNAVHTIYVHMSTVSVVQGQWVDENTQIGTIGAVGYTFPCPAYHLHYAVYGRTSASIDPGPLKACHGGSLVSYPGALGYSSWDSLPPWELGVWSDGTSCTRAAPGTPTDITARPEDHRAVVSFTPPASDGFGASYTVTASPGGAHATGPTSPLTVDGLTDGTSYTFTVTAANDVGAGSPSAPSNAVVPAGPPAAPTGVRAVAGNRRVTVTFAAPTDNGSPITSYTATASPGGAHASGAESPLRVLGLTNGRHYTFRVTATNAVGTGAASAASHSVTPVAPKCTRGQKSTAKKPCR